MEFWKLNKVVSRKMRGTVDSIFTLKMLIDKYVKSNHRRAEIYSFHASSTLDKPSTVNPDRNYSTNWEKTVSKDAS